jgi:biotin carboxylase
MSPLGVIVDGYSTGQHLAPRFAAAGVPCVHVESAPPAPFYARTFRPEDYVARLAHRDLDETVARLRELGATFVLAGAEPGVPLTDALGERLGLPTNGTALSDARRDKFAMGEALRRAGVPAVEQIVTGDVEEAVAWALARDDWPVVVKPVDSAGTDGVIFCLDPPELRAAFAAQLGHPNALGGSNRRLLVQEQLRGTQFFINSISWDGVHAITEVWRDTRRRVQGAGMVCDREQLLPARGPEQDVVIPYVACVLDALGIRFGAGHAEVMLTARGPVLIECAARMQGSMLPDAVERATPSHVAVTVEAYLDPATVRRRAERPYELAGWVECIALISEQEGIISSCERLEALRALPAYHSEIAMLGVGDRIKRTVDLFSSPGSVYLVHHEEHRLREEYERLRAIEREGLFEVEPVHASLR